MRPLLHDQSIAEYLNIFVSANNGPQKVQVFQLEMSACHLYPRSFLNLMLPPQEFASCHKFCMKRTIYLEKALNVPNNLIRVKVKSEKPMPS